MSVARSILLVLAVLLSAAALPAQEQPNFFNLVVIGDSLAAGVRSGGINADSQQRSFAALLAQQMRTFLLLPLLDPRLAPELVLRDASVFPPRIEAPPPSLPPGAIPRTAPFIFPTNLAVPGHNTADALLRRASPAFNSLTDLILGIPALTTPLGARSQAELALIYRPSFVVIWIGSNDTLGAALRADPSLVTPVNEFAEKYTVLIEGLRFVGATMVVANIPDVTVIPFLTPATKLAAIIGLPLSVIGPLLGIAEGDFVTANAFPLIAEILQRRRAGPLPPQVVLTADEAAAIRSATSLMNQIIAQIAGERGIALVNINAELNRIAREGLNVAGRKLTTDFLGGLFSLDGIHPTNTGQAIIANMFIDTINSFFKTNIPRIDLAPIVATDPLVLPRKEKDDGPPPVLSLSERDYRALLDTLGAMR